MGRALSQAATQPDGGCNNVLSSLKQQHIKALVNKVHLQCYIVSSVTGCRTEPVPMEVSKSSHCMDIFKIWTRMTVLIFWTFVTIIWKKTWNFITFGTRGTKELTSVQKRLNEQ